MFRAICGVIERIACRVSAWAWRHGYEFDEWGDVLAPPVRGVRKVNNAVTFPADPAAGADIGRAKGAGGVTFGSKLAGKCKPPEHEFDSSQALGHAVTDIRCYCGKRTARMEGYWQDEERNAWGFEHFVVDPEPEGVSD